MSAPPIQPITKEAAAKILTVSKRTIENWIADGSLLAPTSIGRRVYWHPDDFYSWLNQKLRGKPNSAIAPNENPSAPTRGRPRTKYNAPVALPFS